MGDIVFTCSPPWTLGVVVGRRETVKVLPGDKELNQSKPE